MDLKVPELAEFELDKNDSAFIHECQGPNGVFGVFEDAVDTGWLYLYSATELRILNSTRVYNRCNVTVDADDVDLVWSSDLTTCGVAIWAQMRAFLGIDGTELRRPVLSKETPGFQHREWPIGFGHLLPK